ncbi:MAG: LytTR family DNA-binding domain-containing protein [Lachnospiraceae bacterium]
MNIAVVDDNIPEQQELSNYISKYCTDNQIHAQIDTFENGTQFLSVFYKKQFDLIFLDIYMSGDNGIQIAEKIRQINPDLLIVFSTTSRSHAIEGFRVRAFDYLVKPYSYDQFVRTMDFCNRAILKHYLYIEVKEGRYFIKILLCDIIYTDYYNHYIQIHTKSRIIRSYMPFSDFAPILNPYPQFLACYRNCLVNMDKVESLDEKDFIMTTGERVPISRGLKLEVRQAYADYIFNCVNKTI